MTQREDDRATITRRALLGGTVAAALSPAAYRLSEGFGVRRGPGEVVLSYMAWGNPQQLEVERQIIALFNERCRREGRNVRVELFMPPAAGYGQKMRLMLASGCAPDVLRVDHYDFPSLVPKGYFRDLTDYARNDPDFDPSDFCDVAWRENHYRGRLYGLNVLFGTVLCYYNQDLFAQALLPDPYELWKQGRWTWDEFERCARELTVRGPDGRTKQYGFLMPGGATGAPPPYAWALWVWNEGGEILSSDFSRCLLDSPEAIRAFTRMRNMRFRDRVSPTPADAAAAAFNLQSGNVAMEFNFAGMAPTYRDSIRDFRWDVVATPCPSERPFALVKGNQLVISATCPYPRQAWEWVKFMVSPEIEMLLHGDRLRRGVPTRKSLLAPPPGASPQRSYLHATRPFFHTDVVPHMLAHGKELPIDMTWPAWTARAQQMLDRLFIREDADVEEVLRMTTAAVNRVIARERQRMARYMEAGEGAGHAF